MIRSQRWKGAAFTVPFQLGFVFLYLLPIAYAVYESLFQEKRSGLGLGGATREFTGFDNYQLGLTDSAFMGSILRVVLFACVQIPFMLLVSLVLALFLDALTAKAANRFRIVLLVPYIVLGSSALKRGRTAPVRAATYGLALIAYGLMLSIARTHHPLGLLRPWLS